MESESDVIESLKALAYPGKCLNNDQLTLALEGGPKSEEFREIICWLTHELKVLRKTDEEVSSECNDPNEFAMELSAMLKELGCPYNKFVAGPLSDRFQIRESLIQLLDYLVTELMATKMSLRLRPAEESLVIKKTETHTARALEQLSRDLCLGKPPENVTPKAYFDKINFKVEELIRQVKPGILCEPLLRVQQPITDAQWKKLDEIHSDLDAEYNLRRQVLLTRLEVTIQSFQWSEKMRSRENEIVSRFQKKLQELEELKHGGKDTDLIALLTARSDLAIIEKTSSANVRKNTASKIQKHVIGSVPDRGGRANEHAPPPPEMPSWQQQRASGPAGGGGFRGGRGGGGGGGHRPSYANQQHQQQRPQFEQCRDQNWISGSGRVQGSGWTQGGTNGNYYETSGSGKYHNSQQQHGNGGSGGSSRGRSNYNRGGYQRR